MSGLLLLLLLPALLTGRAADPSRPQRATHATRPRFQAEVTAFIEADRTYAALHLEVPYAQLCFRRDSCGVYRASFEWIVHVYSKRREIHADAWPETLVVADRRALWGERQRHARSLLFDLAPGPYEIEVILSEPNSGHGGSLRLATEVPFPVPGQVRLGSVLVGRCGLSGRLVTLRADPRVRSRFDSPAAGICAYTELYHPALRLDSVDVRWQLHSETSAALIDRGRARVSAGDDLTRLHWPLPIAADALDAFQLQVEVTAESLRVAGETRFSVQSGEDPPLDAFFRDHLRVLEYIAEEDEVRALEMAAPRDRARLWEAFWAERDPTPGSQVNEFKREFFRRLNYANAEFGLGRPGWRTDRGRIYIRHGEPDQIERYPFRIEGPPMEIWHYERLGRRYVFLDQRGYGVYELVSPE
ncbi:MAG: GWxTD domain-containing protein [Candidatus Eisenbacteria bacterium]|nr:GWxTD domain-containing protein [Candidatus Eisenbacteria bacterium]